MSEINWDLVNEKTVVHCKTEQEMSDLLIANRERGGDNNINSDLWKEYGENTGIKFKRNKEWEYCSEGWYKENGYDVVEYSSLLINDVPNVITILGLVQGKTYKFKAWNIIVNENYELVFDGTNTQVAPNIIIYMINHPEDIHEIKMMTQKEIEELVGCRVIIIG